MVAEVVGGALANSLAIMSDAAHLLSDVAGMVRSSFFFCDGKTTVHGKRSL